MKLTLKQQRRIEAELRGELPLHSPRLLCHRALLNGGELGPLYQRHLCVVIEPNTGRYLGVAVAVLRRDLPESEPQP